MSPTPSDKTELKPTGHAGDCSIYSSLVNGSPEDGICTCGYGAYRRIEHDYTQMYSKEKLSTLRSDSKCGEESSKSWKCDGCKKINYHGDIICLACGWDNSPREALPSSPADKCREAYKNESEKCRWHCTLHEQDIAYDYWNAAWQASRKECEEENDRLIPDVVTDQIIMSLKGEIARLKQELEERDVGRYNMHEDRARRIKLEESLRKEIASWQSVVEKKNKLLGWAIENIKYPNHNPAPYIQWYESTQSSLHIDQSGGKKEEEGQLNQLLDYGLNGIQASLPSVPVTPKEPTAEECLEWLGYRTGYSVRVYDLTVVVMIEKLGLPVIAGEGLTPLEAIRKAMRKSSGNDGSTDDQLKSKERKEI